MGCVRGGSVGLGEGVGVGDLGRRHGGGWPRGGGRGVREGGRGVREGGWHWDRGQVESTFCQKKDKANAFSSLGLEGC